MKPYSNSLPTLMELVRQLQKLNKVECEQHCWSSMPALAGIASVPKWSLPMKEFVNDADDNKFVVVQTQHGRHTLKPNLAHCHFLYRGQNTQFPHIISSFSRDEFDKHGELVDHQLARDKHLVANLKAEAFISLLRRHPIFMMLDRGICLEAEKEPVFINMNYYGLAQHYGFKTGVIDFTTDLDVAAFFACTKSIGFDRYEPITDTRQFPVGVIYVHDIQPDLTFKLTGFSTIGLQLYPRSGAQKGVLFNEGKSIVPVEKMVRAFPFRHDANVSRHFFKKMKDGMTLFPQDAISKYAKQILESSEVAGSIFTENLYSNQDALEQNLASLERQGIRVNWRKRPSFTSEMRQELKQDLKNGLWEQFCQQIIFADTVKGAKMQESLLQLPKNPAYAHFFDMEEYYRIAYHEEYLHENAKRNAKHC